MAAIGIYAGPGTLGSLVEDGIRAKGARQLRDRELRRLGIEPSEAAEDTEGGLVQEKLPVPAKHAEFIGRSLSSLVAEQTELREREAQLKLELATRLETTSQTVGALAAKTA